MKDNQTYKHCKGMIPFIRLRNWEDFWHFPSVIKVSVLDVLSKPVLDELSYFFCDWDSSVHDAQVSASMLSNVVLVIQDCGKHTLLIAEVFIEECNHFVPDFLIFTVGFNLSDSG